MMNAAATTTGTLPPGAAGRANGAVRSPALSRRRGWLAGPLGLALLGGLVAIGLNQHGNLVQGGPALPAIAAPALTADLAVMPATPSDGVLTMVIPRGAAADQRAGGRGYVMPAVVSLRVGDTIVLRNDDDAPHMILYAFLRPGQTHTRTFAAAGSEVYSSGCGLHAASFLNFTTIFVDEAGTRV